MVTEEVKVGDVFRIADEDSHYKYRHVIILDVFNDTVSIMFGNGVIRYMPLKYLTAKCMKVSATNFIYYLQRRLNEMDEYYSQNKEEDSDEA